MKVRCKVRRTSGFTMVEIMVVSGIIGLLAALAIPNIARARESARLNIIFDNLRRVEQAKDMWALENNKPSGAPIDDIAELAEFFNRGGIHDVINETYEPNPVGTAAEAILPPGVSLGAFGPGSAIPAP